MPEIHENTIGNKLCQLFIEQQAAADRILNNIYTDVTGKEPCHCASPDICPASQGHVHEILSNSPFLKTGVTGIEGTGLYPAMYSTTAKTIPVSRRGLLLQEAEVDARNYVLKFLDKNKKECWIQLQPLTHTVVQIYTKEDWIGTITKVDKAVRGFKVALAFKFQKHVMAFVSQDLLFKVFWKHLRKDLPVQYVDIYHNPARFLEDLVTWMHERRGGKGCLKPKARPQNALLLVRDSPIFHGVGLYTVAELWHMAGFSPALTEGELFDSPSRTARLCAAYYHFAYIGHNELWDFTKKHLHGYVVAAHTKDRKLFSNFLHVWGQDRCYLSQRHFNLLEKHKKTGNDAFEPELVRHAFSWTSVDLGLLIFGQEVWEKLSLAQGLSTPNLTGNPLKKYFSSIKAKKSGIDLLEYQFLFHAENIQRPLSKKWMNTYCYRGGQRDIWSIYPGAPFEAILGDERKQRLLSFVTQHRNTYTVGPLDYCGTAKLVHGSGKDVVMFCEYDPQVSDFYVMRRVLAKETVKLKAKGVERSGIEPAVKRKLVQMVSTRSSSHSSSSSSIPISLDTTGQQIDQKPRKRLRRSADLDISLSTFANTPNL